MPEDLTEDWLQPNDFYNPENCIVEEWRSPIITKCSECGYDFPRYDRITAYKMWCDSCILETPANLRFKQATTEDLAEMRERQAKTRQSLKQRALDKKNKKGLTVIRKDAKTDTPIEAEELLAAEMTIDLKGDDVLIFNETGED